MIDPLQIFISFIIGAWFASYVIAKHNDKFMEIINEYNEKLGVKKKQITMKELNEKCSHLPSFVGYMKTDKEKYPITSEDIDHYKISKKRAIIIANIYQIKSDFSKDYNEEELISNLDRLKEIVYKKDFSIDDSDVKE